MVSKNLVLLLCLTILESHALNCRSEGSLKSEELKKIYNNCLKQNENKNSSNSNKISSGLDWRDRGSGQNSGNDWSDSDTNRRGNRNNKMGDRGEGRNWMDGRVDRMGMNDQGEHGQMNRRDSMNDGRIQYNEYGRPFERNDGMRERNNHGMGIGNRHNSGNSFQDDRSNEQNSYYQNDDDGSESQPRNMYSSPNRRYKRDRSENSGQRSQYNPNTQRSQSGDNHRDNKNSSENMKDNGKACAMHCFLDNLHMTGEHGMPDRYLVTNVLTKDVRNEDLRDFLQESIEECFQILDNENTEDKCEFSKNLLICLSEKGRSNCDDWKDDIQFT